MGGDLNLKKSWHPMLMSNQERVWKEEKAALEERKRIQQMMKERQEERQIQELQEMQEAAGGPKKQNKVDWMYAGPSAGQTGTTEEMEGYLLGKRRIDPLVKGTENQKLQKDAGEESFMGLQNANTTRDIASKIRDDPLLAIKKQEQAAYEKLMNDPVQRRLLLKASDIDQSRTSIRGGGEGTPESSDRERRRHKHYHVHKSRRHDDHDRDRHHHHSNRNARQDRHHRNHSRPQPHRGHNTPPSANDAAARLAAMQSAANDLDQDRAVRIREVDEQERRVREEEDRIRARSGGMEGKGEFVAGMQRKVGEMGLGERMRRGRGEYVRVGGGEED